MWIRLVGSEPCKFNNELRILKCAEFVGWVSNYSYYRLKKGSASWSCRARKCKKHNLCLTVHNSSSKAGNRKNQIFSTRPERTWGQHIFMYNGNRVSLPGAKRSVHGAEDPLASSAEVEERLQLCLCSTSALSWHVLG